MAKFVFKLQNILSIKEKLEDQAKAEYGMEIIKLREEEDCLKLLIHKKKESYQQELKEALAQILVLFEIKKLDTWSWRSQKIASKCQKIIIKKQQKKVDQAREKLDEAMKERKTFEKLKEKAFEEFKLEIEAQGKKEADELTSFRFGSARESEEIYRSMPRRRKR